MPQTDEIKITPSNRLKPTFVFLINQDWAFLSHRLPLARALRDSGAKVIVATAVDKHRSQIENEGFAVEHIPFKRSGIGILAEFAALVAVIRLYRRIKPDVVHQVALKAAVYGSIASKFTKIPVVVNTISGLGYVFTTTTPKTLLLRAILKTLMRFSFSGKSVRVVFQNPDDHALFLRQSLIDDPDRTSLVMGSGVDIERFKPTPEPEGVCKIVLPARMLKEKGIFEAVEAARILKKRGLSFEMVLAGGLDPDNPGAINEQQLQAWTTEGVVHWIGYQKSMDQIYRDANIVCLPSYREGLPLALLEAAASARALVATDVPGCRHVVLNNRTGLLVPPKDSQSLAESLAILIQDKELRFKLAQEARLLAVREFSNQKIISQLWKIFKSRDYPSRSFLGEIPSSLKLID